MHVISLPPDPGLGEKLATLMKCSHARATYKTFPDGELYLRLPSTAGEPLILVSTTYPDQNRSLMELFFALEYLGSKGFRELYAVVPYMAYGRQDKEFLEGEVVSGRAVLRMLRDLGLRRLFVVDMHSAVLMSEFKDLVVNTLPARTLADYVGRAVRVPRIVIAPDVGASGRAEAIAKLLGCEYAVVSKFRDRITGEVTHRVPEELSLEGFNAVIVDDIVSTGGTVASIAKHLLSRGVEEVHVIASHGLFVGDSLAKLSSSGVRRVAVLNTVSHHVESDLVEYLDVTGELLEPIRNVLPTR